MTRGADTRGRIKQEAMRLFVERGVDAVSVRDIAEAVGMKPSNLYAHFRSREELVQELFSEGYREYGRQLRDAHGTGDGFRSRFTAMIRLICSLHDQDTTRFRFLLLNQNAVAHAAVEAGESPVDVVQEAIAAAMDAGEVPRDDPAVPAAMAVGAVLQVATFRMYGRVRSDLSGLAPQIAEACLRLVAAGPHATRCPGARLQGRP